MSGTRLPSTPAGFSACTPLPPGYMVQGLAQEQSLHSPLVTSGLSARFLSLQSEQPWKQWCCKGFIQDIKRSTLVSLMHDMVDAALRKGSSWRSGWMRVVFGTDPYHHVMCPLSVLVSELLVSWKGKSSVPELKNHTRLVLNGDDSADVFPAMFSVLPAWRWVLVELVKVSVHLWWIEACQGSSTHR